VSHPPPHTQKTLNNIVAYAKPFFAKFCSVIGTLYPDMDTKFGEFTLTFGDNFSRVPSFLLVEILSMLSNLKHSQKNTNAD